MTSHILDQTASEPITGRQAVSFEVKLSFGEFAGQIALMYEELVKRRYWISKSRFLHALNYCVLLPGLKAQQLAQRNNPEE